MSEIARFRILSVLGTGAQGVVILARDHEDASTEPLVLKVLKERDPDSASVRRLRAEARILAWLDHPNIVKVHRLLEKDGLPIVVMEHVEGVSASDRLRAGGALPAGVAVAIAHRTALALDAAYNTPGPDGQPMRIVHRDVKPANLLLSVMGEVKVVDFGIAIGVSEDGAPGLPPLLEDDTYFGGSEAEEEGEIVEDLVGTPGYIAPERRSGGADSPAVDVYALGATLFAMVTGRILVQPVSVGRHDASLARAIERMAPEGVDEAGTLAIRQAVLDFCRFDPALRPSLSEAVVRLGALSVTLGDADLAAHARAHIAPLVVGRDGTRAHAHPCWPDLAFLELDGRFRDLEVDTPGPPRELALRPASAPPEIEPMLATLAPPPWWGFWRSTGDPASLVEALVALRGTRDPRAVLRAWELTRHTDPRVTEAAWELLAAAC